MDQIKVKALELALSACEHTGVNAPGDVLRYAQAFERYLLGRSDTVDMIKAQFTNRPSAVSIERVD